MKKLFINKKQDCIIVDDDIFVWLPKHGWHGVIQDHHRQNFRARIQINNKRRTLGSFRDPEDAARAYDAALVLAGKAPIKFPFNRLVLAYLLDWINIECQQPSDE